MIRLGWNLVHMMRKTCRVRKTRKQKCSVLSKMATVLRFTTVQLRFINIDLGRLWTNVYTLHWRHNLLTLLSKLKCVHKQENPTTSAQCHTISTYCSYNTLFSLHQAKCWTIVCYTPENYTISWLVQAYRYDDFLNVNNNSRKHLTTVPTCGTTAQGWRDPTGWTVTDDAPKSFR
jgi:hypothetical protein